MATPGRPGSRTDGHRTDPMGRSPHLRRSMRTRPRWRTLRRRTDWPRTSYFIFNYRRVKKCHIPQFAVGPLLRYRLTRCPERGQAPQIQCVRRQTFGEKARTMMPCGGFRRIVKTDVALIGGVLWAHSKSSKGAWRARWHPSSRAPSSRSSNRWRSRLRSRRRWIRTLPR